MLVPDVSLGLIFHIENYNHNGVLIVSFATEHFTVLQILH